MFRCAVAGIEMFYDHGDRERRDMARFRFVLDKMGEEKFIKTFLEYFYQSDVGTRKIDSDLKEKLPAVPFFGTFKQKQPFFEEWFDRCVLRTRWKDIYALKIIIPRGNLEPFRLNALADLAYKYSGNIVRLTRSQDILLPYVHATALPYIHNELHNGDLAAFLQVSFRSKIVSCIGASVCKMGFFNSMEYAVLLSNELDKLFKDFANISDKDKQQIVDAIKISGCPNSCGGHLLAPLGFEGIKKRNTGNSSELCFSVFTGGSVNGKTSRMAEPVDEYYVPAEHLATFVKGLVSAYLNRHGDMAETFADYICSIGKDTVKKYYKL